MIFRFILVLLLGFMMDTGLCNSQMIVAHRGASHDAPENTLAAFKLAWQQGTDAIEGDFFMTADRHIVCIHNRDTEKVAGVKLAVEQSTLAELRQLDVGAWKDLKWKGEVIPTLGEVIETVPEDKTLVIEVKSGDAIVPVLIDQLRRVDPDSMNLLVISFSEAVVIGCKQRMPDLRVHWLTNFDKNPTPRQIAETVRRTGADGVGMQAKPDVINAEFAQELKRHGCAEFHVWTVDSVADAKHFLSLGAVGITTNLPAVIGPALRN